MNYTFFDKQKIEAKSNYNYFIMRMIFKVLLISFKLSFALILSQLFNNIIIKIFSLIYVASSIYNIYFNIRKYNKILKDIKETININNSYIEIDFSGNLLKKVINYGK